MSSALEAVNQSEPTGPLQLSQKAALVLANPLPASRFFPLSLFGTSENPETWTEHEQLFLACLRTGDDKAANLALERLTQRFGADNHRVMGLRALYQEAVADDAAGLEKLSDEYEKILATSPMNVVGHMHQIELCALLTNVSSLYSKDVLQSSDPCKSHRKPSACW